MALFGAGFRPAFDPSQLAPQQAAPQLSQAVSSPMGGAQGRGLFGRMSGPGSADKWGLLAAGIADAVDPLTMRPTGGGTLAALMKQRKDDQAKQAQQEAFQAAYDPATGKLDQGKFIAAIAQNGGGVPESLMASLVPKDRAPQVIQRRDGSFGTLDPDDPNSYQEIQGAVADPNADLVRELMLSRIGATNAQTDQRKHMAAKPYFAPPRARSGGGSGGGMGAPRRVSSASEFAALPSGSTFVAPDGTMRRKP